MKKSVFLLYFILLILFSCEEPPVDLNYDWKAILVDKNLALNAIYMINDETGYVGGDPNRNILEFIANINIDPRGDTLIYQAGNGLFYYTVEVKDNQIPRPVLYKTVDGGESWQGVNTPFNSKVIDIQFINENVGYIISREGVYKTLDGGQSWNKVLENIFYHNHKIYHNPLTTVCFIDEQKGFVHSNWDGSILLSTRDGGESWKCISIEYPSNVNGRYPTLFYYLEKFIFFSSSDTAYIINSSDLYKTTDMGDNWELIYSSNPIDESSVYFSSPQIGHLTYHHQVTKDGGITWSEDSLKLDGKNLVLFDTEYYYSEENMILRSHVSEYKPHRMTIESNELILDLIFPSDNVGYALASGSIILKYNRIP